MIAEFAEKCEDGYRIVATVKKGSLEQYPMRLMRRCYYVCGRRCQLTGTRARDCTVFPNAAFLASRELPTNGHHLSQERSKRYNRPFGFFRPRTWRKAFPRLPEIPSLEEAQAHIPVVPPVTEGEKRPLWSVMIPTYNRPKYLRQALESVLAQDPGPDEMQIEVLDNYSTIGNIEAIVNEVGRGRVAYFCQPKPNSDNANTCILRSRGQWVHIMHDDDMVMPGFYEAYRNLIEANPRVVMVAGKAASFDERGCWTRIDGEDPEPESGLIEGLTGRLALKCTVITPAIVVRREAYERVGGFCPLTGGADDRELWFRIAMLGPVAGTLRPYFLYRRHKGADSSKHAATGRGIHDGYVVSMINHARLHGGHVPPDRVNAIRSYWADYAETTAGWLRNAKDIQGHLNLVRWAWTLKPNLRRARMLLQAGMRKQWRRWTGF